MQRIPKIGRQMVQFLAVAALVALVAPAAVAEEVISGPPDSVAFGTLVTNLPNGKLVITDPGFNSSRGAVYLYATNDLVNPLSTIMGSVTNDRVGAGGITVLANGNYLIHSPYWSTNRGAVTWVNATNGLLADGAVGGVVAATNSLVGATTNIAGQTATGKQGDLVGYKCTGVDSYTKMVTALPNGHYVVASPNFGRYLANDKVRGAVTWCDGTKGATGVVSTVNSLVGKATSSYEDKVGYGGIVVLNNAECDYVVQSPFWYLGTKSGLGAATWCRGTNAFPIGVVTNSNSLVGTNSSDYVGLYVTALSNGHYVVASPNWKNGNQANAGAVTWCDGTAGRTGAVSTANSLVGTNQYDYVGFYVTALANGHYVVASPNWKNGAQANAGAVTWCDGTVGRTGAVSTANSLVGANGSDQVGRYVTALSNGHYVVASPNWKNGTQANAGAVTWCNGTTGLGGVVSVDNSLVGSTADDQVGYGVCVLPNGNYVVASPYWDTDVLADLGAVTWCNGTTGRFGTVSTNNSLVGSTASDQVGYGVCALSNGNYVVASPYWDNRDATDAGAVTWGNGTQGVIGAVSPNNSLVGNSTNDAVGSRGVCALATGNYVVASPSWTSIYDENIGVWYGLGAVTWGNGTLGVTGVVSDANSLVGTHAYDQVGSDGVCALANGNYVVASPVWTPSYDAANYTWIGLGAVTWGDGNQGVAGEVSAANSLVGSTANDLQGPFDNNQGVYLSAVAAQPDGNYLVVCPSWDDADAVIVDAGAVTPAYGVRGAKGLISALNSVRGATANQGASLVVVYDASHARVLVGEPGRNRVTLRSVPVAAAMDPPGFLNAAVTAVLTNGATCHGMLVSTGGAATAVGLLWGTRNGGQELAAWDHTNWFNSGAVNPAWTNDTPFSTNLTDLADGILPNQTYYYTWLASNAGGTATLPTARFFLTGEVTVNATDTEAQYPGNTATFRISRPGNCTNEAITVSFGLSGSAVHGTDYATIATNVTLAAGATYADVVITPYYDTNTASEAVVLTLGAGNGVYPYGALANAAAVAIVPYAHTAGAITTVQAGNWTNPATWGGALPGRGDDVTITHHVTLDVSLPFAFSCVSNSASATLTFQGTNTILRATTLLVGGTLTHDPQSAASSPWTPDNRIWLQCANLTVLAGGKIDAKGKGYAGGISASDAGRGLGGGASATRFPSGAAHGGRGFGKIPDIAVAYGSVTQPETPGSGGGGAATGAGGAGGGWVTIEATEIVNVAAGGLIDVSGDAGASTNSAGGAGGSVCIHCDTIQGDGDVRAAGGNGSQTGGNGSGGRIAVYVNTAAQQAYAYREEGASKMPSLAVSRGDLPTGDLSGYYDYWNMYVYAQGGSIYVSDPSSLVGDYAGGATFSWGSDNPWVLPYLSLNSGEYSFAATGVTVAVAGNVNIMGDARLTLTNYFTLSCASLLLTNTASLYLCPGVTNATAPSYTARVIVNGNMDVHSNCVVVPSASQYATHESPDGGVVRLEVGNLTIHAGGGINADGAGYAGACGPGKGSQVPGCGAGGGYGGVGGDNISTIPELHVVSTGGVTYGWAEAPMLPGSGGGNGGTAYDVKGGYGGGCIWIRATGAVVNDGTISANGSAGGDGASKGGGGSGGSIFIVCRTMAGNGTMAANGAIGRQMNTDYYSGGGAGGRIAIWYDLARPADLDAFLARGSTAYLTNAPAGYTLNKLSVAGGAGGLLDAYGQAGTKSFYRANPTMRTVIILR